MRRVVDTNYLNRKEFRNYLAASRDNVAVLMPYAELEILKADTQNEFLSLTEIMAHYPGQIIISKDMHPSARLRGKQKGMKKRLTDGRRTSAVRKWLRTHDRIQRGEKLFHARVKARNEALAQIDDTVKGVANFCHDLQEHAKRTYTPNELAAIGRGEALNLAGTMATFIVETWNERKE